MKTEEKMPPNITHEIKPSIEQIVSRIIQTGKLSRQEHFDLVTLFVSDFLVTEDQRNEINLVFDNIQKGQVKFLD